MRCRRLASLLSPLLLQGMTWTGFSIALSRHLRLFANFRSVCYSQAQVNNTHYELRRRISRNVLLFQLNRQRAKLKNLPEYETPCNQKGVHHPLRLLNQVRMLNWMRMPTLSAMHANMLSPQAHIS